MSVLERVSSVLGGKRMAIKSLAFQSGVSIGDISDLIVNGEISIVGNRPVSVWAERCEDVVCLKKYKTFHSKRATRHASRTVDHSELSIDLSISPGDRFGRWVVVSRAVPKISPRGSVACRWSCVCDCGARKLIQTGSLTSGKSKSCGCLRNEILALKRQAKSQVEQ